MTIKSKSSQVVDLSKVSVDSLLLGVELEALSKELTKHIDSLRSRQDYLEFLAGPLLEQECR